MGWERGFGLEIAAAGPGHPRGLWAESDLSPRVVFRNDPALRTAAAQESSSVAVVAGLATGEPEVQR